MGIKIPKFSRDNAKKVLAKAGLSMPKPKELSEEQENILEKNLVWVFASPRSGTSWLANELLTFQTHSMDEPYVGHHLASIGIAQDRQELIESHRKRSSYFFADFYKNTWTFYLRKLILNRIYAQFEDIDKKIIIKEPNGSMGADNIIECTPNSKIIFVLRDGRDVIDSLVDARSKKGWGTKLGAKQINEGNKTQFIERHANLWRIRTELLLSLFENHPSNLCHKVKYEDLRKNTKEELEKIYKFLEIDVPQEKLDEIVSKYSFENIPDSQKGSGKVRRSASPGKWKENFSEEEQKIMNEKMGETLKKLGYDA